MKAVEISAALASKGIHLDPINQTFQDCQRVLDFNEVCALLPEATDCEIAAWAKAEAVRQRHGYKQVVVQLLIPEVAPESIAVAKRVAALYPEESEEHRLAVLVLDLAEELATLNADLGRVQGG